MALNNIVDNSTMEDNWSMPQNYQRRSSKEVSPLKRAVLYVGAILTGVLATGCDSRVANTRTIDMYPGCENNELIQKLKPGYFIDINRNGKMDSCDEVYRNLYFIIGYDSEDKPVTVEAWKIIMGGQQDWKHYNPLPILPIPTSTKAKD